MSGGGMGGTQTTTVEVPEWYQSAARGAIGDANQIAQIGYVPYYGPDVAAFQPAQMAAFENTGAAANAFGMNSGAPNIPQPQEFAPGVTGYSSAPILEQAMRELSIRRPGQYEAISDLFVDPFGAGWGGGGSGGSAGGSNSKGGRIASSGANTSYQRPYDDGGHYNYDDMYGGQGRTLRNSNRGIFGGGGGVFAPGSVFGDGGFFDDTPLDLGLIDGNGRYGFAAPVTSRFLGGTTGRDPDGEKGGARSANNEVLSK